VSGPPEAGGEEGRAGGTRCGLEVEVADRAHDVEGGTDVVAPERRRPRRGGPIEGGGIEGGGTEGGGTEGGGIERGHGGVVMLVGDRCVGLCGQPRVPRARRAGRRGGVAGAAGHDGRRRGLDRAPPVPQPFAIWRSSFRFLAVSRTSVKATPSTGAPIRCSNSDARMASSSVVCPHSATTTTTSTAGASTSPSWAKRKGGTSMITAWATCRAAATTDRPRVASWLGAARSRSMARPQDAGHGSGRHGGDDVVGRDRCGGVFGRRNRVGAPGSAQVFGGHHQGGSPDSA